MHRLFVPALLSLAVLSACAGKQADISSIGAPEPVGATTSSGPSSDSAQTWGGGSSAPSAKSSASGFDGEAVASRDSRADNDDVSASGAPMPAPERQQKPGLGTSYGEQRFSSVRTVRFRRANPSVPDAVLSMRYDDAEGVRQMAQWKTGGSPQPASSQAGIFTMTLRDEVSAPLAGAQVGGDTYAVGETGARYTIGVENHSAYRYEVVASVDGLDVIDGAEADFSKRGYLIDPYTSFVIDGWRTGDDTVAAFRFSDMDSSYAGRTGKARNIGVIGVAFFHEQGQASYDELRRRDQADPFPNRYAPPPPGRRAD